MERSFYYPVSWSSVREYKKLLDEKGIPYEIQSSTDLPVLEDGYLAIVFPSLPNRTYVWVRTLFSRDGYPYPDEATLFFHHIKG
jgi:hypothetical protein